MPLEVSWIPLIEYVLAHALVHLEHPYHGADFWAALGRVMPEYLRPAKLDGTCSYYCAKRASSFVSWLVKPSFCISVNCSLCMRSSVTTMRT